MDETIINNHNEVVGKNDDFYFLGDFCFGKDTESFLKRLNGNKFFIKGNHDNKNTIRLYHKYGTYLGEQSKIKIGQQDIIINHYAMRVWNKSHHGSFHLYGHSHGSLESNQWGKSMDVGIMMNNYYPFEYSQIYDILSNRDTKFVDHHETEKKDYSRCDYCNVTPTVLYLTNKGRQCQNCYNNSLTHY